MIPLLYTTIQQITFNITNTRTRTERDVSLLCCTALPHSLAGVVGGVGGGVAIGADGDGPGGNSENEIEGPYPDDHDHDHDAAGFEGACGREVASGAGVGPMPRWVVGSTPICTPR